MLLSTSTWFIKNLVIEYSILEIVEKQRLVLCNRKKIEEPIGIGVHTTPQDLHIKNRCQVILLDGQVKCLDRIDYRLGEWTKPRVAHTTLGSNFWQVIHWLKYMVLVYGTGGRFAEKKVYNTTPLSNYL